MKYHCVKFNSSHDEMNIPEGIHLANYLTAENSPVLFGCRSGICGTCLVEVIPLKGKLPDPNEIERETLSLHTHNNPNARLACQIELTTSILLKKIKSV